MHVAVLHDDFKYFTSFAFEQTVVGKHNRRASTGLEDRQHVLKKIQLLVRRLNREVFALRRLVRAPRAEWRISQDDVEPLTTRNFIDCIAQNNFRFDAVQVEVHRGEAARSLNQILTIIGGMLYALCEFTIMCSACLLDQPFVSGYQKATHTPGRR